MRLILTCRLVSGVLPVVGSVGPLPARKFVTGVVVLIWPPSWVSSPNVLLFVI
jgi:hypothetical protein